MSPTLTQIVLLSVVQGIAEPLPVSSSAHVIAAERIMHLDPSSPEMLFLLAMLHTGTVLAVILYFWESWKRSFFSSAARFRTGAARIALATVATLGVYFLLEQLIKRTLLHGRPGAQVEDLFSNLPLIAAALAAGGALILVSGLRSCSAPTPPTTSEASPAVSTGSAFWIGITQGIVLPFRGLSRSGATISTGMLLGVPRRLSEEFSFALAVVITPPVIAREALGYYRARAAGPGTVHLAALATPGSSGWPAVSARASLPFGGSQAGLKRVAGIISESIALSPPQGSSRSRGWDTEVHGPLPFHADRVARRRARACRRRGRGRRARAGLRAGLGRHQGCVPLRTFKKRRDRGGDRRICPRTPGACGRSGARGLVGKGGGHCRDRGRPRGRIQRVQHGDAGGRLRRGPGDEAWKPGDHVKMRERGPVLGIRPQARCASRPAEGRDGEAWLCLSVRPELVSRV